MSNANPRTAITWGRSPRVAARISMDTPSSQSFLLYSTGCRGGSQMARSLISMLRLAAILPLIAGVAASPDRDGTGRDRSIAQQAPASLPDAPEVVIERPTYHCLRTRRPVQVDGVMNERI